MLDLNNVTSGYSTNVINNNFSEIERYINENLLNRDGVNPGEPNQMEVDLDMNSRDILNVGRMNANEIGLGGIPIKELLDNTVEEATQEADRAEQEADRSKREADRAERVAEELDGPYEFAGDYTAGITLTKYSQVVRDSQGEFWRVSGQVDLPYTTTGDGLPESGAFVSVGDAVLRQDLADPDIGAALVAYKQPVVGAKQRNVSDRLFDLGLSPTEMASFDTTPGADNTQAVIDAANAVIDSVGRGVVFIPYGVIFDKRQIQTPGVVPPGVVFWDYSIINGTYPGNGVPGIFDAGDPTAVVDFKFILGSGHNASLYLNNSGSSGSETSKIKGSAVRWAGGEQSKGSNPGLIMPIAALEFHGDNTSNTWSMVLRHRAPWVAARPSNPGNGYWRWASGELVEVGEVCFNPSVRRYYESVTAGITGGTAPNHLSGESSDGGVTWRMLPPTYDQTVFSVDERGRLSLNSGTRPSEFIRLRQQPDDTQPYIVNFEASAPSKNIVLQFRPTDAAGNPPATLPRVSAEPSRIRIGYSDINKSVSVSEEGFGIHGAVVHDHTVLTNSGSSPSAALQNTLVINNGSPVTISSLQDVVVGQQVTLIFTNANTTVANGSGFRLAGGVDFVPGAVGGSLTLRRAAHTLAMLEISRAVY